MKTIMIHGNQMTSKLEAINYLKSIFELEQCQGNNLDALWDCLGEQKTNEEIIIFLFDEESIKDNLGNYGNNIIRWIYALPKLNDNYSVKIEKSTT